MYTKVSFIGLLILALSIGACNESDDLPPTIEILAPVTNSGFIAGDTIPLTLQVEHETLVKSVTVILYNDAQEPVSSLSKLIDEKEQRTLLGFPLDDPSLESGNYVLLAIAYAENTSAKSSVAISIEQAERKLEQILVWSSQRVFSYTDDGALINSISTESPIKDLYARHREKAYLVLLENGIVQYRDIASHDKLWTSSNLLGQGSVSFTNWAVDQQFVFAQTATNEVYKIDNVGRVISKKNGWFHSMAVTHKGIEHIISVSDNKLRITSKNTLQSADLSVSNMSASALTLDNLGNAFIATDGDLDFFLHRIGSGKQRTDHLTRTSPLGSPLIDIASYNDHHFILSETALSLLQNSVLTELLLVENTKAIKVDMSSGTPYALNSQELMAIDWQDQTTQTILSFSDGKDFELVYNY